MSNSEHTRIRLFIPTFQIESCLAEIKECLEIGWTGSGFKTLEFEKAWAEYTGVEESLFISSNSVGLDLALRGMKSFFNWEDNSEIISTALTFVSTNHAILLNKLIPVFAEVDKSLCLDPVSVRELINNKTKAIMYVGIGGNAANLQALRTICDEFSLKLIIDAAHMAGTKIDGGSVEKFADSVVYSFQAVKNLPTADSGVIYVKNPKLREKIRKLSWLGINSDTYSRNKDGHYKWMYEVEELGLKANGNSIMASIALVQLRFLDEDNTLRSEIVNKYKLGTKNNKLIEWIFIPENVSSSWHLAQVRIKNGLRDELIKYLDSRDIDTGVHYRLNTRYSMYENYADNLSQTYEAEREILSLPLHLRLTNSEIDRVIQALNDFEKVH